MSEELTRKSATELATLIRSRSVSPVEVVEAHLYRIEQINPSVNAIVTLAEDAIDCAIAAEAALLRSGEIGPLHGVPLTVKDTIDTRGLRTTSGSVLRRHDIPKNDATVVARLKAAGAIILGKTNTSEMAIPYETDNPVFGRTNNPHNPPMTSGGSSGGEAAAVAAYLSPAGVGSDLSGSIRVPAHFCGIAGLKPTTGLVPMDGHVPLVTGIMSLGACIGPMARHVEDLALLLDVISDGSDHKSAPGQRHDDLRALRVAWYSDDSIAPVTDETRTAVGAAAHSLREAGIAVSEERPPAVSQGSRLWIELFSRAAREQLRAFYRGQEEAAGPTVSQFLCEIDDEPKGFEDKVNVAEKLAEAVVEREHLREELLRWMKTTPLILAPVGATPAFAHGAQRLDVNNQSVSVFRAFSYSQTFNVFGLPSLVVPAGRSADGLPIGVQIVGRPFGEKTVLLAGAVVEKALGPWQSRA